MMTPEQKCKQTAALLRVLEDLSGYTRVVHAHEYVFVFSHKDRLLAIVDHEGDVSRYRRTGEVEHGD